MDKTMTYTRIRALSNCLQQLAGREKPMKDKDGNFIREKIKDKDGNLIDGNPVMEYVPFRFPADPKLPVDKTVRSGTAINQASLSVHVNALQAGLEGVNKLAQARGLKQGDPVPLDLQIEMNEATAALLRRVVKVTGLKRINYDSLDPDGNDIPTSVVAGLIPVLANFPAESTAPLDDWQESEQYDPEPTTPADGAPSVNGQPREKVEA